MVLCSSFIHLSCHLKSATNNWNKLETQAGRRHNLPRETSPHAHGEHGEETQKRTSVMGEP